MALKKDYLKKKDMCKVRFSLPKEAALEARKVCLVGEFNEWDTAATPMKKQKDGSFAVALDLRIGNEYQFRYLLDDATWENDWAADRYQLDPNTGTDNSVVIV